MERICSGLVVSFKQLPLLRGIIFVCSKASEGLSGDETRHDHGHEDAQDKDLGLHRHILLTILFQLAGFWGFGVLDFLGLERN